ncbi:MAG: prepilin-type N-terminal cleavage/methylation domain-containing protein [Anaplasmataceae bacterium]|nr:prepilin-type N-terminal cleavage/methylation domain-containing protein [Anaplasmataceae bacterium]
MQKTKGFTLIELLIVIAIIAVLAVVVVLTLNPAELLRQARDSTRLSDVAAYNSALAFYLADIPGGFHSTSTSRCYAHGVSTATACQGTTTGMGFATAIPAITTSATRTINGTGWLPLTFNLISSGSPFGILPIDPLNNSQYYYRIALGTASTYKIIADMESTKFSFSVGTGGSDVEEPDGGTNTQLYEAGNDLAL